MKGDYQHSRRERKHLPPLDTASLRAAALAYVGRYATSRARLAAYLARKLRERGWDGGVVPPIDDVVAQCAELGYVDDQSFATARGAALRRRGYGAARVRTALRNFGIEARLIDEASEIDTESAMSAGMIFARRKRIGPYANAAESPETRRKSFAAMMRAGHSPDIARRILSLTANDITSI